MKKSVIALLLCSSLNTWSDTLDMDEIRVALSAGVMNSTECISYKPIYKEIETILRGEDSPERKLCVELAIEAMLSTEYPFILSKDDDASRKCRCMEDRERLFFTLLTSIAEIKADRDLNLRFAQRLGSIQLVQPKEGLSKQCVDSYNRGIMSFRSKLFFIFTAIHRSLKTKISLSEFETFVHEFLDSAHASDRERSDYMRIVFGGNYKSPKAK